MCNKIYKQEKYEKNYYNSNVTIPNKAKLLCNAARTFAPKKHENSGGAN